MSDDEERQPREAYERARAAWLRVHAPERTGREPLHSCVVDLPGGPPPRLFMLEELAADGALFGAFADTPGLHAFGSAEHVLAAMSGRAVDDPWVRAVCAALVRERSWMHCGRRLTLSVRHGSGELFHVSAAVNRESIRRHGLDWRRMGSAMGVARSREPELPGCFLCERSEVGFFTSMARVPSDVWAVSVDGLRLENGPDGWELVCDPVPIPSGRLRLVEADLPPGRARS